MKKSIVLASLLGVCCFTSTSKADSGTNAVDFGSRFAEQLLKAGAGTYFIERSHQGCRTNFGPEVGKTLTGQKRLAGIAGATVCDRTYPGHGYPVRLGDMLFLYGQSQKVRAVLVFLHTDQACRSAAAASTNRWGAAKARPARTREWAPPGSRFALIVPHANDPGCYFAYGAR
jgi:hypothetical protein